MDFDDIIYMVLLIFSIGFGNYYRGITDKETKKWLGTCVGLSIALVVSGFHIWHCLLTFIINAFIILILPKSHCHLVSFAFSFSYLLFFRTTMYFGISYAPGHTNMIQMLLTLKLVGLAFEVNSAYLTKNDNVQKTVEQTLEDKSNDINPDLIDIFHYTFNYIGLLTGPYYRYRTFSDFFEKPFAQNAHHNEETIKKLTFVPMYCALFLLGTHFWPLSYAVTDEFYNERSWLYRFWFAWPTFFNFRMRIYIALVLSECVCTMAGLGAYPDDCEPKSGLGPSKNFVEMNKLIKATHRHKIEKYNFETIHNINPYGADFCTTFREAMKNWNICIQYWLAVNVYKRFPNKKLRTSITLLVSAFWHGMYIGHYVCIGLVPFYLLVEDVYVKLFLKDTGKYRIIWEWIIWFFKMQAFSYLGMAFGLLTLNAVIRFYHSVYYCGFIGAAVLYLIGMQMLTAKRAKVKRLSLKGGDKEEVK